MSAVDVGVGHDDDPVVAELLDVEAVADPLDPGAERDDQRADVLARDDLVEAIRYQVKDGVDAIKVSGSNDSLITPDSLDGSAMSFEEYKIIADETHRLGKICTVHARSRDSIKEAAKAGFDMLEFHAAHGYFLASFLSPLPNQRKDRYGGSLKNRLRYPLEVFKAMRAVWPQDRPMSVRISAHDWVPGGITPEDAVQIAKAFKAAGADLIDAKDPDRGALGALPAATVRAISAEESVTVMEPRQIARAPDVRSECTDRKSVV